MGALREEMVRKMQVRRLSLRTQEAYVSAVVGLTKHYRRSPDTVTPAEIEAYLHYLTVERKLAWSLKTPLAGAVPLTIICNDL